jgi:hypothetical protein
MKVKDIVKQTEEFKRLQRLIDEFKGAIADFGKVKKVDDNGYYIVGNTFSIQSVGVYVDGLKVMTEGPKEKTLPISLSEGATELIREDFAKCLRAVLVDLEAKQDALTL